MKTEVYPLAVPIELYEEVRKTAKAASLSIADIMRLSLKAGLPLVSAQLDAGRVTNVEPVPYRVARKLYEQPEDDEEGIRLLMSAQSATVQE